MIGNISKGAVVESSSDDGKRRRSSRKRKRRKELPSVDGSVQLESSTAPSTNSFEMDNGDEENNDNVPSTSVNNPTSVIKTTSRNPFKDENMSYQGAFITLVSFLSYQV